MSKYSQAIMIAAKWHVGQVRQWTDKPYVLHPLRVAASLSKVGVTDDAVLAAAVLHDVLEDTEYNAHQMRGYFGNRITDLVLEVTNVANRNDGNRAARQAIDTARLANVSADAQSIKLADVLDNVRDVVALNPGFAKVYLPEKRALLDVLTKGNRQLFAEAMHVVEAGRLELGLL